MVQCIGNNEEFISMCMDMGAEMKHIKRIFTIMISFPFVLLGLFILYSLLGMGVNHISTYRQTKVLKANLEKTIEHIQITDVYSETGNTSGTGNHVDCLTRILFSTDSSLEEIKEGMSRYYEFSEWGCFVEETEEGYLFYLNTSAPFADNIEGH